MDDEKQSDPDSMIEPILKCLMDVTKCANGLPKLGQNFELYNSYSMFADLLKAEGFRLKSLLSEILKHADCKVSLQNVDTLDEMSDLIEKASDLLAERIANYIDETEGYRKQEDLVLVSSGPVVKDQGSLVDASWNKPKNIFQKLNQAANESTNDTLKLLASRNVARPQLSFQHLIDNSNRPFVTKLKYKHNSMERMTNQSNLTMVVDENLVQEHSCDAAENVNPYKYELDHYTPNEKSLERYHDLALPDGPDKIPYKFIQNQAELENLCQILKSRTEFSVDLEHHSYRTFQGLTCLMQISTEDIDFLVDTLKLWTHMHILNDPFTDPKILKVFHGAYHDIEWLQRDFGIYVVNMFDTGQAMRVLGMARFSLSHLIKTYLNIDLNKEFQLADWRIRPLPKSLVNYAREDTRYLLYCYRRLKNDLLDAGNERKNLLISVFERSRDLCARHYEKPLLLDESRDYMRLCTATKKPFNSRQKMALKDLYAWRDETARLQDESIGYVLPNHMMLQIAEVLPREMQGLLSCCNPVPPLVRQNLHDLHKMVFKAKQAAIEANEESTTSESKPLLNINRRQFPKPHDFSHIAEDEELVPRTTMINFPADDQKLLSKDKPRLFAITLRLKQVEIAAENVSKKLKSDFNELPVQKFMTPYEMYLRAQIEREKKTEKKDVQEITTAKPKMYNHLQSYATLTIPGTSETPAVIPQNDTNNNLKRKRVENGLVDDQENSDEESDGDEIENAEIAATVAKNIKKSRKKKKKLTLKVDSLQNYDYAQAEKEQIEKFALAKRSQKPVFDPNTNFMKQKFGKKGRKFGKKQSKSSSGR